MLRRGIVSPGQFELLRARNRAGVRSISYALLDLGDDASETQQRLFEAIQFRMQTTNGTFRTSFPARFRDVDAVVLRLLAQIFPADAPLRVQDRACSHALTSFEFAVELFRTHPRAELLASDRLLHLLLISLPGDVTFIAEPDGKPLQYIRPPFVVSLCRREPLRFPLNLWIAARARRRFPHALVAEYLAHGASSRLPIRLISCVHPKARQLSARDPRFRIIVASAFATTEPVEVVRTMNILHRDYFPEAKIREAAESIFASLREGGLWIVGKTLETDFSNHATIFQRSGGTWRVLERVGNGADIESLVAAPICTPAHPVS